MKAKGSAVECTPCHVTSARSRKCRHLYSGLASSLHVLPASLCAAYGSLIFAGPDATDERYLKTRMRSIRLSSTTVSDRNFQTCVCREFWNAKLPLFSKNLDGGILLLRLNSGKVAQHLAGLSMPNKRDPYTSPRVFKLKTLPTQSDL